MKIDLLEFLPKSINGKKVIVGLSGDVLPIGKMVKNFNGKIIDTKIRKLDYSDNSKSKILKVLFEKDASLEKLTKETKLSQDNLRWHIIRSNNSLLKIGLVRVKERIFCPYEGIPGGVVRSIFTITDKGKNYKLENKQRNPRRKELVLINSDNEEFILSSWWSSWLKPRIENLKFDFLERRFLYKVPKDQILVQYEKSRGAFYSAILPKEIDINNEHFITALGLLLGEMRIRKSDISFSNTEPFLANYVLSSLKSFGLSKEDFNFSIQVNTKNYKPEHGDLITYWSKELGISKSNIFNIFEYKNYGTNRAQVGRIDFIYWNIVLKEIINNLINYFLTNSRKNKDYAIYMLRGLLAAEGYVCASTISGALDRIGISSCSDYNKKCIINLLKILGITAFFRKNAVVISSKENFNKIIGYELLKISKDKTKFIELYRKLKYQKERILKV